MPKAESNFFNRELSWLEFNQRVLEEAQDQENPLLERLKFIAITASNLDEFFMVRVGGLRLVIDQNGRTPDPSGMTPKQQLKAITKRCRQLVADQYSCFSDDVEPKLAEHGIRHVDRDTLTDQQSSFAEQVFRDEIFPLLTPIAIHDDDDFPLLINQTLNLLVELAAQEPDGESRYAVIPFGRLSRRFIQLPSERGHEYLLFEDAVALFVQQFFPSEEVIDCVPFRVTRNADLAVQEDQASDLLLQMEKVLLARKQSRCVRLEIEAPVSKSLRSFLVEQLEISSDQVYELSGPLDLAAFFRLTDLQGFESLCCPPWPPQPSIDVDPTESIFETIARRDVLLTHPYEQFDPVIRLVEEAAADPDVLAIKQTLYRSSRNSPIVNALQRAAENGKYVTAVVEVKARFDEARNIEWAKKLEDAEVQVLYGVKGLKTHAKICVVVRKEPQGIVRYVHFGTGNYNENTARLYTDAGMMTCDDDLASDATTFFNTITGFSQPRSFRKIAAAPLGLRDRVLEMIDAEIERRKQKQKAAINAKINALVDPKIIEALYRASQAGVKIRLCVRGVCCLRPGIEGLSENIRVISIVDRLLEHSRIIHFLHGGDDRVFISSADWMPRNLDRRIELLTPIEDEQHRKTLIRQLELAFDDNVKARELQPDGSYIRVKRTSKKPARRSQEQLYQMACGAVEQREKFKRTVFEPHRAPDASDQ